MLGPVFWFLSRAPGAPKRSTIQPLDKFSLLPISDEPYSTRLIKVRLLTRQSSLASISTQVQDFWQRAFVCLRVCAFVRLCVCAFVRLPPRNAKFFQTLANFRSSCLFLPRLSFKHRGEIGVRIAFLKTCLNACACV